jgi:hypothetical protein
MKRSHLNLALLAVVAGLGTTVWLSQEKEEKGPPLTALKADAVTRVAVEHPGQPAIRLQKTDGVWTLVEPVASEVDSFEINGILALADRELKSTLDAGVNKAELQLDPPQYSVTLNDTRIDLGGVEPIKARRYVKVGDTIGLVDDPPSAALDADYSDLVSRALVPEKAELSRIELPGLSLEKNAQGAWISPQQPDAPAAQVAKLADGWKNARALWNAAAGDEAPAGDVVKLTLADGRVLDLVVAERDPQLVLARRDLRVRYTLSKALVEELFKIPAPEPPAAAPPAAAPAPAPAS